MPPLRLILASASPRRQSLLGLLGYPFTVVVSGVDEDVHLDNDPPTYVARTARHKAEAVAQSLGLHSPLSNLQSPLSYPAPRTIIIAADTTVALGDTIMGKPANPAEARAMLRALRGRERNRVHAVHTAVCVLEPDTGRELVSVHSAAVTMRAYNNAEIDAYIATGDPFDKAGAYAIQHPTFQPVARLAGCFLGVVGLSLCDLILLLRQLDVPDRFDPAALVDAHQGFRHGGEQE